MKIKELVHQKIMVCLKTPKKSLRIWVAVKVRINSVQQRNNINSYEKSGLLLASPVHANNRYDFVCPVNHLRTAICTYHDIHLIADEA